MRTGAKYWLAALVFLVLGGASSAELPDATGLIGYWPGDGDANDYSGNNLHGTLMNGVTFVPGKHGQAFHFDGLDDTVQLPATVLSGPFTISAWWSTHSSGRHSIVGGSAGGDAYYLQIRNNIRYKYRFDDLPLALGEVTVPVAYPSDGSWHHVALTKDSSNVCRLYHDGILQERVETIPRDFHLGFIGSVGNAWNIMNGAVDDLAVYDRDLYEHEIRSIATGDGDGDGLLDEWETDGYTHTNGEFVDLPLMGADPMRKDVFVQIDYLAGFRPSDASLEAIVAAFAAAPLDNPDGTTGIKLHILVDEQLPHVASLGTLDAGDYVWSRPGGSEVTHFDDLKTGHFAEELGWAVRYCIWADSIPGNFSGMSRGVVASDFIVSLGPFIEAAGGSVDPRWESGTFMHELGHALGLKHGGGDGISHKPNYLSVMNPSFQLEGIYFQGARGYWDFSFETLPDLDESVLDETKGLGGSTAVADFGTTWWMDGLPSFLAQQWVTAANDPINWWDESVLGQEPVFEVLSLDINDSEGGLIETLAGFDDWDNLSFKGGAVGGGVVLPERTPAEEQTLEEVQAFALAEAVTGLKGHDPNKMYTLTWNPIKPKTEMTEYRVYRDGTQIAATTNTNHKDQAITPGDTHVYWITWVNLLGQESVPGNKVTISG